MSMREQSRFSFKGIFKFIIDILYYFALIAFLFFFLLLLRDNTDHRTLNGYASFYIETNSMASVYPRGSMIITQEKKANELEIGDDVTYFDIANTQSMVTHRIIDKLSKDDGLYFQTQGVDNEDPDKFLVPYENIVGQVVYSVPQLGIYMNYLRENMLLAVLFIVLLVLFVKTFSHYLYLRKKQ